MLSINMRIFKTVLLLAALASNRVAQCLPVANETSIVETPTTQPPLHNSTLDYFDQRQNGSTNFRVHVDGLVFAIVPIEAILLAAADDKPNLPVIASLKPTTNKPEVKFKPLPVSSSVNRAAWRLANLWGPLLDRVRQE